MTDPEHYRKAEELAAQAHEDLVGRHDGWDDAAVCAAMAQVHATLALAAATALGRRDVDNRAWGDAAGVKY
jgi:hypothetical protein